MINYYTIDKSPFGKDKYFVKLSDEGMKKVKTILPQKFGEQSFSYLFLTINLFGLRPKDFFAYVASNYGATVERAEKSKHKIIYFSTFPAAAKFCQECDRRFKICVDGGYFG